VCHSVEGCLEIHVSYVVSMTKLRLFDGADCIEILSLALHSTQRDVN